jgi:hypothetical protein
MKLPLTIPLILLLTAAAEPSRLSSIDGLPIGELARQTLPAQGCAAYLFSKGKTNVLAAMATAQPATLRIALDGKVTDFARTDQSGDDHFGIAGETQYRGGDVTLSLNITVAEHSDLTQGGAVPEAVLRIDRPDHDSVAIPLAGLIGCAA